MTNPIIRIHDAATGEVLDREMTESEFETYQAEQSKIQAEKVAIAQKNAAKAALLERLGITEDEAKLLLA
jgi:hypothetical protein